MILVDKGSKRMLRLSQEDVLKEEQEVIVLLPIFLDEEWLHKFGFVSGKFFTHPRFDSHQLIHKEDGWYITKQMVALNLGEPLLFVHELQNFFYELTGEELTLY
jgi:hypothetical protein